MFSQCSRSLFFVKDNAMLLNRTVFTFSFKSRTCTTCIRVKPPNSMFKEFSRTTVKNFSTGSDLCKNTPVPTAIAQTKKRTLKKKKCAEGSERKGFWSVVAFSTAEEYDLDKIIHGLQKENLYEVTNLSKESGAGEVVHAVAKYEVDNEPRELFFFSEGSIVMWNLPDLERLNVLKFLKVFETSPYPERDVQQETEIMSYTHSPESAQSCLSDDDILLSTEGDTRLEKYTISNSMALSVKLGTWEASLSRYVDSMELVTEDLKTGNRIKMSREEVLRKTGELFVLRHAINLSSDLLDTPDFYWDREDLERLYQQACSYYCISRRTRVMNEKINHCVELVELLSSHLNDNHHVRLEWMIIVLIMVEVGFEIVHYLERVVDVAKTPDALF